MEQLVSDIEAFLAAHTEISATAFGQQAMSDRHLVRQLRAGRRVWPETEKKVRDFMAQYDAPIVARPSSGKGGEVSARVSA